MQSTNGLDLAVSGDGFFAVKPNTDINKVNYTRNGGFSVNDDHYVVDGNGGHLQVYPVDGSGAVVASDLDNAISLKLPETSGVAEPTTAVKYTVNLSSSAAIPENATFDRFDPTSYNQSTSSTIYDTSGNALTMTSYFVRASNGGGTGNSDWKVFSFVGDKQLLRRQRYADRRREHDLRRVHAGGRHDAAGDQPRFRHRDDAGRRPVQRRAQVAERHLRRPAGRRDRRQRGHGEGQLLQRRRAEPGQGRAGELLQPPRACVSSAPATGRQPACRVRRAPARRAMRASATSCRG